MVKIAILGFGTVGSGVYEVVAKNNRGISKRSGQEIRVKYILDLRDFPGHPLEERFTKDYDKILSDDEVEIIVETMGGLNPAYEYTKRALLAGKHVVTSNKELVATYGAELLNIAKTQNVNYMFEASVGGGIPIIRPLHHCLAGNEINEIVGILNGTTNYILTQMINEGVSFEDALSDAQAKGYAERNPDADVLGFDACRKIAILASLACHKNVDYKLIETEGITEIKLKDVNYVAKFDSVIKLLGVFKIEEDGKVYVRVSPAIISNDHPLANVTGVFNGILVKGNAIGDVVFYGQGAGKLPTASAVVGDIIDITRNLNRNNDLTWDVVEESFVGNYLDMENAYYVRLKTGQGFKAEISALFGECEYIDSDEGELVFITPVQRDGDLIDKLNSLSCEVCAKIRLLEQ